MTQLALSVAAGGAIGSVLRYFAGYFLNGLLAGYPALGTLAVNLTGCFLIGAAAQFFSGHAEIPAGWRDFAMAGCLGGFTTYSSFSLETWRFLSSGQTLLALGHAALHLLAGLAATAAGIALVKSAGG
ncbi:MAG: putative fluoride ion transporter CrcB [Myxococcota bacterium]|nr:putative fluoride ion transporter CrcB [Myxococcota bacterium]